MAKGNVELWLGELLNQAMHSLHAVIRDAYHAINDGGFQLMSFLGQFPSQVRLYDFLPFYMCYCGVFTLVTPKQPMTECEIRENSSYRTMRKDWSSLNILVIIAINFLTVFGRLAGYPSSYSPAAGSSLNL